MRGMYPSYNDLENLAKQVNQAFKRIDMTLADLEKRLAATEKPKPAPRAKS